jgi:hypothetical protein
MAVLATSTPKPGDLAQIDLFAEHVDLAAGLIRDGGVARGRMALVATDNLAEVLLYRHAQFTYRASEEIAVFPTARYDDRERQRLRYFDRRVRLATVEHTELMSFGFPKPILSSADATIFRVSHRYRNAIYHEDRHNTALVAPLARLYLSAVGRAWCRAQPEMGTGGPTRRLRALPYVRRQATSSGYVALPQAVEALAGELLRNVGVRTRSLAKRLAADLVERSRAADELRHDVRRRGLPAEAHAPLLLAAEVRHEHRADPELVRLKDEMAGVMAELVEHPEDSQPTSLQDNYIAKKDAEQERIDELRAGFRPTVNLRTSASIRQAAERLERVRDVDRLLARYETHDQRMRLLEICLDAIDEDWDRIVTHEEEVARGK